MFQPTEGPAKFPTQELETIKFWKENKIYEKSLQRREGAPPFVFFEGPPTANGMPHPGHCLTRAIKDLFPRYKTMKGFLCTRKAGWDTHGLPVEVEVCKELGIHSKEEIEAYGIEPFIQKCQSSVWRYMQEWERMTERIGFWVNLKEAYVTYHQSYVESVWWSLKNLFDRGLLYKGHKIVWWWAQGGTALSAGEVGQGYRKVADPSVFVKFPLLDETSNLPTETSLLVWTTTPWTLPSNQFAAVHPELEYAVVLDPGEGDKVPPQKLILAAALVETLAKKIKRKLTVESTCLGTELIGRRYVPPFDCYYKNEAEKSGTLLDGTVETHSWRILGADFVTTESGSGAVHLAPAFGEVDYEVLVAEQARYQEQQGPELICAVASDGKFTEVLPEYQGRWVKEADKDLTRDLRQKGLLYLLEQYLHDYPFCWRADQDPLIQYPRESWFISTRQFKEEMLSNNQQINWLPKHIKDGRFGKFLESNVDWSLSRERFWGTPLPIWVCQETGQMEAIGQYDELLEKPEVEGLHVWRDAKAANPELPEDLKVHKPYIDAVSYASPFAKGARMQRVTEVIDCWYDSGAMPFAQWGYRGQETGPEKEKFDSQFPADFISEALDQTRGWFYSQLAISTMLFGKQPAQLQSPTAESTETANGLVKNSTNLSQTSEYPHPFKNCIVLGLMLGEDGQKMSKSKGNYSPPQEIFDKHGADALRWYLYANQPPWTSIRYSEQAVKDSVPEFLLRLWNVYSFFVIYANIDGFDPSAELTGEVGQLNPADLAHAKTYRPLSERREIDRWIIGELNHTIQIVTDCMDQYDNYGACTQITEFVDALSNWYVRSSRERYWMNDKQAPEKLDAYWTLYECLLTTSKLIAPFVPFLAEHLWGQLTSSGFKGRVTESVHLCDYPTSDASTINQELSERMCLGREISSLGRNARSAAELKVRQPLAKVEVVLADMHHVEWLTSHVDLIKTELNVKQVEFSTDADQYITYSVQPDFKRLGPRVGKNIPVVKKMLSELDGGQLLSDLKQNGKITLTLPDGLTLDLDENDITVRMQAKEGWAAAQGKECVIVLSTELTPELIAEGYARDLVRIIQDQRKEIDCDFTDRILVGVVTSDETLSTTLKPHLDYILSETLADSLVYESLSEVPSRSGKLGDKSVQAFVQQVPS